MTDFDQAKKIILNLFEKTNLGIQNGYGPFFAAIYDEKGNLIAESQNSVIADNCSNSHAEINAIKSAQKILNTFDLSAHNLSIYITAEPCIMCMGAIMWSGIKKVFFSVPSKDVEEITGFDEGFKPNWIEEFNKRGIEVFGEIEVEQGKNVLKNYVSKQKTIYKPKRNQD